MGFGASCSASKKKPPQRYHQNVPPFGRHLVFVMPPIPDVLINGSNDVIIDIDTRSTGGRQ
ncbi:hypothetical protein K443DRAFT_685116 [Laccaria amethystina LaAM-08-1]|uniref:Uncharacterized protein n=1 Tax=Laccaria amethystina LaAM-08-1 TaxID=1095629 RepID=A0A0C9X8H7_9AGAR|nr:hypothetical protein K443DRAFT_685116 [Laccaria amethystina LaAM-08-1]